MKRFKNGNRDYTGETKGILTCMTSYKDYKMIIDKKLPTPTKPVKTIKFDDFNKFKIKKFKFIVKFSE